METEQKQKKILFAGLTLLVLAGIFLYSASLLDRNTPVIQTAEPQLLVPTEPEAVAPKSQGVKEAEPVIVAADWKTYRNTIYGIEFRYPKEWPAPVFNEGSRSRTGMPENSDVNTMWQMNIGNQERACEGEWCHIFTLEGYVGNQQKLFLEELSYMDDMFPVDMIESKRTVNSSEVVVFSEPGMCGYRSAFIFGKAETAKLSALCGDDDSERTAMFDAILSTLKLSK